MAKTIPLDVADLTAEGVDVALALIAGLPDGASTDWAVIGPQLEAHRFHVQTDDEAGPRWEVSTADFTYSAQDAALPRAVARALLVKHVVERKGQRFVLRLPFAKAKTLFGKDPARAAVDVAVLVQNISDDDTVELELTSMWEDL
ncbi:hypothetical protein [Burkholderia gladioli]|uniref:hypothetical protein n=1 Tax=Burkholderia gladioli TaxID=28095 RepID=UPI001640D837|nr:hypothetical protein [Burkholderia gladioli]